MKPSLKISSAVLLAAVMAGCAKPPPPQVDADVCVFPDSPQTTAPAWICDAPVDGVELSAVGYGKKSAAGASFMKQMAATDARVQLAQTFKTKVNNMIKQYAETTGAGDAETVNQVFTSVSKTITSETLTGSRIFKTRTSPSGGIYVLVGLDSAKVQEAAKDALQTSMNNDQALWQEFKAKKAQDELAAEIAAMK